MPREAFQPRGISTLPNVANRTDQFYSLKLKHLPAKAQASAGGPAAQVRAPSLTTLARDEDTRYPRFLRGFEIIVYPRSPSA
jgi:hypothetical protein